MSFISLSAAVVSLSQRTAHTRTHSYTQQQKEREDEIYLK